MQSKDLVTFLVGFRLHGENNMGKIESHLNVYHFITAIINGNDLK